jgi:hypothetical protein
MLNYNIINLNYLNKKFFNIFPLFPKKPLTYKALPAIIRVHKHRDLN